MRFYKTDWFLKVTSLVVAILIWFYVVYQENPTIDKWVSNIPIAQRNISADFENGKLVILSVSTGDVDVKVGGRRRMVSSVNAASGSAYIDMSKITDAGEYSLPINVNFALDGLDVVQLRPNRCTVIVDRVVTEERPVELVTKGDTAHGYAVDNITADPSVIKLTGPQSLIERVAVCSISVDVTDADEDIKGLYKVKLYDEREQEITGNISKNIEYIDVYCSISAVKEIKVRPLVSSETNLLGGKVSVSSNPSTIIVRGKTTALNEITEVVTDVIDVSQIYESTETEQSLRLPDGLFFVNEEDKTVKIKISVARTGSESINNGNNTPDPVPEKDSSTNAKPGETADAQE